MDMDSLFLGLGLRPQKRRVRPPNLDAAGVFRLIDVQGLLRRHNVMLADAEGVADSDDRVADPGHAVVEVLPAAGAQVPAVRVYGEPILVQVRSAAVGAGDESHREAEDRADHVVDRVELADHDALFRQTPPEELHGPVRPVRVLWTLQRYTSFIK